MTISRIEKIRDALQSKLQPSLLEIIDESEQHIGHAGAKDGRGHFALRISAEALQQLNRVQQHRLIYQSLGDLMTTDIHALRITII